MIDVTDVVHWQAVNRRNDKLAAIAEFFKVHDLPVALRLKTNRYSEALWNVNRGIDHFALLQELPYHLKEEILVAAHTYISALLL